MFRTVVYPLISCLSTQVSRASWSVQGQLFCALRKRSPLNYSVELFSKSAQNPSVEEEVQKDTESTPNEESSPSVRKNYKGKIYKPVDLATSLEYMNSEVFRDTYHGKPIWFYYRRNFKGHFAPPRTRPNCVVAKKLVSSNPCPICRDEYLILDYRNTELLRQFINPVTLEIFGTNRTGLCQHQHKKLLLEIAKAQDLGTIEMWLPFHLYDYSAYYSYLPEDQLKELLRVSGGEQRQLGSSVDGSSSAELAQLPVKLQNLLENLRLIPRATLGQPRPPETDIERPKVPNRYKMEEDHKAYVAKRKKSRTLMIP